MRRAMCARWPVASRAQLLTRPFSEALLRRFPDVVQPHLRLMRFDKPIGSYLTFWPGAWGLALASTSILPPVPLLVVFAGGAFLMRSAGCVINDLWDKDFDAKVARTASRPLASGAVTTRGAMLTLGGSLAAAASLLLALNDATRWLAVGCVAPVALYPLMKRVSWWPQAFLGLTFNWGALMGCTAVTGHLTLPAVLLYAGCAAWTVSYDTLYAHQDKADDAVLGLRSSALLDDRVGNVIPLYSAVLAAGLWSAALALQYGSVYAGLAALPAGSWAIWLARTTDTRDAARCADAFRQSNIVGPLMLAGIMGAHWSVEAVRSISAFAVPF